ncbi:hypothetical protein BDN67DRAFT_986078 [Paxillus ammoniavirescens]|nr:hypothetical protein BDN67DRAFT_986078 [Paxillus ammoniavirescens]
MAAALIILAPSLALALSQLCPLVPFVPWLVDPSRHICIDVLGLRLTPYLTVSPSRPMLFVKGLCGLTGMAFVAVCHAHRISWQLHWQAVSVSLDLIVGGLSVLPQPSNPLPRGYLCFAAWIVQGVYTSLCRGLELELEVLGGWKLVEVLVEVLG